MTDTENQDVTAEIAAVVETSTVHDTVEAVEPTVVEAVKKVNARRVKTERKPRAAKAAPSVMPQAEASPKQVEATAQNKDKIMNFDPANWMNLQAFSTLPGADKFQTLAAEAGSKGQEALEKGRRVAEELTELTRANVEAMVEAGKIAATGARTVGEEALQRTREGLEQNVAEFKSLAQAGSPTEFFQLQSEIARSNFDRMVATFSQLTESSVKLAGEAIQPLSNRAAINAEKLNELTA
jgi:phasin family protein